MVAGPVEMRVAHCGHDRASYTVAPMVLFILYHLVQPGGSHSGCCSARREVYEYMVQLECHRYVHDVPRDGRSEVGPGLAGQRVRVRVGPVAHGGAGGHLRMDLVEVVGVRACSTYWGVQWHWHWVYHALVKLSERGLHAPAGWYPCQLESCEAPRTR